MVTIGINQSTLCQLSPTALDAVCAGIADFGATAVRFPVDWAVLSKLGFTTADLTPVRNVKAALDAHGLTPLPVLGCHAPLFNGNATIFGKFVGKIVDVFGDIPAYEVWNEPNLWQFFTGGPKAFLPYLRAATPIIRASGAKSIHGGLAAMKTGGFLIFTSTSAVDWLTGLYKAGEDDDYDLLGYHPYSLTPTAWADPATMPFGIAQIASLDILRAARGDTRPYAFTEVGFDTARVPAVAASGYLTEQMQTLGACDVDSVWLFCWQDSINDGGSYGLVTAGNVPKRPLYDTARAML